MSQLPSSMRHDLMRRMLSLKPVVEDAMSDHREDDARRLHDQLRAQSRRSDTYPRIADIINKMERGHMEESLQEPLGNAAEVGGVLKGMLFTFDDIVNLTPKARMLIFDQVPTDRIVIGAEGHRHALPRAHPVVAGVARPPAGRARACDRRAVRTSAKSSRRGGRSPISRSKWPGEGKSSSIRTRKMSRCSR